MKFGMDFEQGGLIFQGCIMRKIDMYGSKGKLKKGKVCPYGFIIP
jgi:hypothetical protein